MIDHDLWREILQHLNISPMEAMFKYRHFEFPEELDPPVFQKGQSGSVAACQQARAYSQSEFSHPIVLIAGAGTGKTATLIARIMHWCLCDGWEKAMVDLGPQHSDDYVVALRVVRRVCAITFTEAAASEMALRIVEGLNALVQGCDVVGFEPSLLNIDKACILHRASALLDVADELTIQTIHAFCQRILTRHAVLANLSPNLTIDADHERTVQLLREALQVDVHNCFSQSGQKSFRYKLYQHCFQSGIQIPQIFNVGVSLLKSGARSEDMLESAIAPELNAKYYIQLRAELIELAQLFKIIPSSRYRAHSTERTQNLFFSLYNTLERFINASALSYPDCLQDFELNQDEMEALKKVINGFLGRSYDSLTANFDKLEAYTSAQKEAIYHKSQKLCASLLPKIKTLSHNNIISIEVFRLILQPLLRDIESIKRREGVLNFEDLLYFSAKLVSLGGDKPARRAARHQIQSGIDLLLVDEFQDTSQIQCELIEALALDPSASNQPALFIVGDPKQSIYGWRNADIAAYFRFVERLKAFSAERSPTAQCIQYLYQNFRSTPTILSEVEQIIAPVMTAIPGLQPPFQPLIGVRQADVYSVEAGDQIHPVEYWVTWELNPNWVRWPSSLKNAMNVDRAALCEARALVNDILKLRKHYSPEVCLDRDKQVNWSDIAIILRARGRQPAFIEALREHQIPYVVNRDVNYFKRREVIEATSMLQCILDPNDSLSLVSFLRSSAVGMPDVVFLSLWIGGFPGWLSRVHEQSDLQFEAGLKSMFAEDGPLRKSIQKAGQNIPNIDHFEHWPVALEYTVRQIRQLRKDIKSKTVTDWLRQLRRAFSFKSTEAAAYQGIYRLANLDRFFLTLQTILIEAHGDWSQALLLLQRAIRHTKEAAEAKPNSITENAVQIMTIHASKGLDFKHVYLVDVHWTMTTGRPFENKVLPDSEASYAFNKQHTLSLAPTQQHHHQTSDHELIRLLYVALTRAKNRLVISGVLPDQVPKPKHHYRKFSDIIGMRIGNLTSDVPLKKHIPTEFWPNNDRQSFGAISIFVPALAEFASPDHSYDVEVELPSHRQVRQYIELRKRREADVLQQNKQPLQQRYSSLSATYSEADSEVIGRVGMRRKALLIIEAILPDLLRCSLSELNAQRLRQINLLLNHHAIGLEQVEVLSLWNRLHVHLNPSTLQSVFGNIQPQPIDLQIPLAFSELGGLELAVPPRQKVLYPIHRLEQRAEGWVLIEYVLDDYLFSEGGTVEAWFRSDTRLLTCAGLKLKQRFHLPALHLEVWNLLQPKRISVGVL